MDGQKNSISADTSNMKARYSEQKRRIGLHEWLKIPRAIHAAIRIEQFDISPPRVRFLEHPCSKERTFVATSLEASGAADEDKRISVCQLS